MKRTAPGSWESEQGSGGTRTPGGERRPGGAEGGGRLAKETESRVSKEAMSARHVQVA